MYQPMYIFGLSIKVQGLTYADFFLFQAHLAIMVCNAPLCKSTQLFYTWYVAIGNINSIDQYTDHMIYYA